jgi:hypothetical protein
MKQGCFPVIRLAASNRLGIEMLLAHLANRFKTPGTGAPLVAGDNNNVLICDAATGAELVRLRQEALDAMNSRENQMLHLKHLPDSGNPPGVAQ